ncbi:MAG: DUF5696 domain-containing protein [Ruminococcus flavefaciens]|nr:DUF5696 domain-containing protein [Ruminococcus flavefaciens]MCM1228564.1 DUF5696 domain-containing protein [Ruminococcus flavefaciens]
MAKRFVLCLLIVFMLSFSGNIYAEEVSTDYIVETVENFVEKKSAGFRRCAENDDYVLLIDEESGILGLENRRTGYIWYSSPPDAGSDDTASELIKNELLSSNVLRYGIPEKRTNNNYLRSGTGDCEFYVSDIENGVRIIYDYSAGFRFPVDYVLESDHLRASLKVSEIEERSPDNIATEVTVMGSFGASSDDEDGYFVIPDGSGALIRFSNNRTADINAYSQSVYGADITAVPVTKGADTEQIYLPVYGIVKQDNAMLVVASKGDSNAYINAKISGQSNSRYNLCRFTFVLRNTDTFYMSGNSTDKFTVFEQGDINSDDIELKYYPISKKNADYIDVAEKYRDYLISDGLVSGNADSSVYINLYGGAEKKKSILGIPVTMKQSVTDYSQASDIISELADKGADNLVVSYKNWTDDGMENRIDTEAEPSGTLGGKSGFRELTDTVGRKNALLYPVADNRDFVSGNGYNSFNSTCVRVSGQYSRIVSYDRAFGIPDGFSRNMSLLSPEYFGEVFTETAENYRKSGLTGISPSTLTTSLYGDYGKNKISRFNAMELAEDSLQALSENLTDGILADGANAYALPYVSRIANIPLESSRFDIFSEDVPFYQIVLHGIIPYSSTAVNSSPNPTETLLRAVASGSLLCYDIIAEETSILKDTELDVYYYAGASGWLDDIAEKYSLLKPIYEDIAESTITGYEVQGDVITTSYSNGTVTITDLESQTVNFNGSIINLSGE